MSVKDRLQQIEWRAVIKAVLQGVGAGILLGAAFVGGYLYHDRTVAPPPPEASNYALLDEVDSLLASHFLYPLPDPHTRKYGAARGLLASLNDPYTVFSEPQTAEVSNTNLAGRFGGIGVELSRDDQGRYIISQVYRDNPAYRVGVQIGDIILAVDGQAVDTATQSMDDIQAAIRGDVGTQVTLTIQREDEVFDVEMTRAEILIPSTFWRILEEDGRIGYIQITQFTDRTPDEVRQALQELGDQDAEAYILDLRFNTGGLVESAVSVTGEFLDGGVVLYEQRQGGAEDVKNAARGGLGIDVPLVVLVNNQTASAAEIVAGALRDHERAILIGQRTFGKGSVQVILALSDGSSIRVTSAQWFTPDHHQIEGQGLTPDIETVPQDGQDVDLAAAITYLVAEVLQ